jgi:hypothetical protein
LSVELDHVFIACSPGAPEAGALLRRGLVEGSPNTHPGQGTACRRFFFQNAYLELLFISDADEARREPALRTRLWERCARESEDACPFGIVLRTAAAGGEPTCPFDAWAYHPSYLPPDLAIEIARDTPLREPGLFHLGFQRGARAHEEATAHTIPARTLTGLRVGLPGAHGLSRAAQALETLGLVTFEQREPFLMELVFEGASHGEEADFRPDLPLVLRW